MPKLIECTEPQESGDTSGISQALVLSHCGERVAHVHSAGEFQVRAYQLLRALEDLHQQGVIHRDIKPSNLVSFAPPADCFAPRAHGPGPINKDEIVSRFPPLVVIDFELSAIAESTYGRCGTKGYMSPEGAAIRERIFQLHQQSGCVFRGQSAGEMDGRSLSV